MKNRNNFWLFSLLFMGLILIFTNSCSKDETDTTEFTIGQNYGGGIIFYIDGTKKHGLICATIDQSSGTFWATSDHSATNAVGTEIGTGQANTTAIVTAISTAGIAAKLCNELVFNGYSDWYLPSLQELILMNTNLRMQNLGGFTAGEYWSSSEYSNTEAWAVYFGTTDYFTRLKTSQFRVRAIRSF